MEFIGTILSSMNTRGDRSLIKKLIVNAIDRRRKIVYFLSKEIELSYTKFLFFSEKYAVVDLDNDIYNFLLKGVIGMNEKSVERFKDFLEGNWCYKILIFRKYSDYIFRTFKNVYRRVVFITKNFELAKKIKCKKKFYVVNCPVDNEIKNNVIRRNNFRIVDFGITYANKKIID